MHPFIHLFGRVIPTYGLMINLGVLAANVVALWMLHRRGQPNEDFVILEAYGFLGGLLGAKALYLATSFAVIDWPRISDPAYFSVVMQGGYVFYGGVIGGVGAAFLAGHLHRIPTLRYVQDFIFLVPLAHAFGRVGCFMAGCCYGIPYDGPGSVVFPEGSFGLSGVPLFPVQLVEAAGLLAIFVVMAELKARGELTYPISAYVLMYGALRFVLEFFRYDGIRGFLGPLSTSQWISLALVCATLAVDLRLRRKARGTADKASVAR